MAPSIDHPTISVVCPTYNSEQYLGATFRSVLDQSLHPLEIIFSDDGSTDGTVDLVNNFIAEHDSLRIVLIRNSHRGPGAARNSGIQFARGEWIAFLDSDDQWEVHKIERVISIIDSNRKINFICHAETHIRSDGQIESLDYSNFFCPKISLPTQLFRRNLFLTSAVVCKRDLLIQGRLFDESLMSSQDYDLWIRLSPLAYIHFMKEPLGRYIDREGNITSTKICSRIAALLKVLTRNRSLVSLHTYLVSFARQCARYPKFYFALFLSRIWTKKNIR